MQLRLREPRATLRVRTGPALMGLAAADQGAQECQQNPGAGHLACSLCIPSRGIRLGFADNSLAQHPKSTTTHSDLQQATTTT